MCYFVNVAINPKREPALSHFRDAGFSLHPSTNQQLLAAFPAGNKLFELTHGGCSCGIYAVARPTEVEVRARYAKRKGWPVSRIERAIESKRRAGRPGDGAPVFQAFLNAVQSAVLDANRLFFFAHSYSAATDSETFAALGSTAYSLSDFLQRGGVYPEDTITEVHV